MTEYNMVNFHGEVWRVPTEYKYLHLDSAGRIRASKEVPTIEYGNVISVSDVLFPARPDFMFKFPAKFKEADTLIKIKDHLAECTKHTGVDLLDGGGGQTE